MEHVTQFVNEVIVAGALRRMNSAAPRSAIMGLMVAQFKTLAANEVEHALQVLRGQYGFDVHPIRMVYDGNYEMLARATYRITHTSTTNWVEMEVEELLTFPDLEYSKADDMWVGEWENDWRMYLASRGIK